MIKRRLHISAVLLCLSAIPNATESARAQGIGEAISSQIASDYFRPGFEVKNVLGSPTGLTVDGSGRSLTLVVAPQQVVVWSLSSGVQLARFDSPGVTFAAANATGSIVLTVSSDGAATAHAADGTILATESLGGQPVGVFFANNRTGYAATSSGLVAFDVQRKTFVSVALPSPDVRAIGSGGSSGDLAVGLGSGAVLAISASGASVNKGQLASPAVAVGGCRGQPGVVAVGSDDSVSLLGTQTAAPGGRVSGKLLAIDRNCQFLATGTQDGILKLQSLSGAETDLKPEIKLGLKASNVTGAFIDSTLGRAVSAEESGMIRVWDLASNRDVLQIYMTEKGWAVIDQNGRFDASQEGMVDAGWLAKSQRVSLGQFSDRYFEPGLLSDYMSADGKPPTSDVRAIGDGIVLPPKLDFNPLDSSAEPGKPTIVIVVAQDQGGGVGPISIYHNGKLVPAGAFLQQQTTQAKGTTFTAAAYRITPTTGANTFLAAASTTHGASGGPDPGIVGYSDTMEKVFEGAPEQSTLHVVVVGINDYTDPSLEKLFYSVPDAEAIATAFEQLTGAHFAHVSPTILLGPQATEAAIKSTLAGLKTTEPSDAVVLYLAGHGAAFGDDWDFITVDGNTSRPSLTATQLASSLVDAPAQRIFVMIDSCDSGQTASAFNRFTELQRRFLRNLDRTAGVAVLAGARSDQGAADVDRFKHGLFTYSVIQGLSGAAARDGTVTARSLADYSGQEMRVLSSQLGLAEAQQPAEFEIGADFVLH